MTISSALSRRYPEPEPATHVRVMVAFTIPIAILSRDAVAGMTNHQLADCVADELCKSLANSSLGSSLMDIALENTTAITLRRPAKTA